MPAMLAILLLATLAAPSDDGQVVERIVAVVRSPGLPPRPITLTRLTEEARVALVGQGGLEAATATLDTAALRATLRWLIGQWLVADEAARLKVDEVAREEVEAAQQRFRERFADAAGYRAFLASADLSDQEVGVMLGRDLRVQHYLVSRAGRAGRVSDEELARSLAGQGLAPESPKARELVRQKLEEEKLRGLYQQLVADLRARVDVRILVPELREDGPR
jgi:hypothetical protein